MKSSLLCDPHTAYSTIFERISHINKCYACLILIKIFQYVEKNTWIFQMLRGTKKLQFIDAYFRNSLRTVRYLIDTGCESLKKSKVERKQITRMSVGVLFICFS